MKKLSLTSGWWCVKARLPQNTHVVVGPFKSRRKALDFILDIYAKGKRIKTAHFSAQRMFSSGNLIRALARAT